MGVEEEQMGSGHVRLRVFALGLGVGCLLRKILTLLGVEVRAFITITCGVGSI